MDTLVFWVIIALFYAPLHYLIPIVIVFFQNVEDPERRKRRMIATAIDCTLSMSSAFALVIWLSGDRLQTAMFVLMISMSLPYFRIWLHRRNNRDQETVT
jgi:uncharacterized membrane protein